MVLTSKPPVDTGFGFGPQNLVRFPGGTSGSMWRLREACVEAKQSREELVAVRRSDLKLDHFAPRVKWFSKNI
jgi:hypothetical protein